MNFSKVDSFKMALLAYTYVFGQLKRENIQAIIRSATPNVLLGTFAEQQLQFGAFREYYSSLEKNDSARVNNSNFSKESLFHLLYGDNISKNQEMLQNYMQMHNYSSMHEYLFSFAGKTCAIMKESEFVRYLIRYGRVCQVSTGNLE